MCGRPSAFTTVCMAVCCVMADNCWPHLDLAITCGCLRLVGRVAYSAGGPAIQ